MRDTTLRLDYDSFDAAAGLPVFIENIYNERRLHSAFGYLSYARFEEINCSAGLKGSHDPV